MKAEFLRHEYTWSSQSISGTIGLGIVSSSTPKDEMQLREMEKMASMAEADSQTGVEVELLMYNKEAGFVKMTVKPVPAAEDQRKNKKVYLYQCQNKNSMDPEQYCLPQGSWKSRQQPYLPTVTLQENWLSAKEIFIKYQLMDRLPDFFRAVFWCVFRGGKHLAFVTPWEREEYAGYTREIMCGIHRILPEELRKNAGYASFGCGMNRCSSFYFTDKKEEGEDSFELSTLEYSRDNMQEDKLDQFFYEKIATIFWENEGLYQEFIHEVQREIRDREINKNLLREIQWMFLELCLQHMIDIPSIHDVMGLFPQLFYRCTESMSLEEVQNNLMQYYHMSNWSREDYDRYLGILENGITRKGERMTLDEMIWTLTEYFGKHRNLVRDYLNNARKNKKALYTKIMTHKTLVEGTVSQQYMTQSLKNLDLMKAYIKGMDPELLNDEVKDQWMPRCIEILNEDVFDVAHFEVVSQIAALLKREEKWEKLLDGFLGQLRLKSKDLDDEQLQAACKIEDIHDRLTGGSQMTQLREEMALRQEEKARIQAEKEELAEGGESVKFTEATEATEYEMLEEEKEINRGRFLPFWLRGLPYGFLTGCVLYLLNYAIVIGHWKISVGVGGMWLIIMLSYITGRMEKINIDHYRTWMAVGLCIVEGYIIQTIAWVFLKQNYRVYFFLILGIIIVILQMVQIVVIRRQSLALEDEMENETSEDTI